jgi:hypothetical protein
LPTSGRPSFFTKGKIAILVGANIAGSFKTVLELPSSKVSSRKAHENTGQKHTV